MIRWILLLPGFLLFLASGAWAQGYEPGFVVLSSGDTLRGEIENRHWEESPTEVRYRATAAGELVSYKPEQLRLFRLASGRYFRSDQFPFDKYAESRLNYLPQGLNISQKETTLFAEVLVEGPATLLRAPHIGAMHYFVRREASAYLELTERLYLRKNARGTWVAVNGNNYTAQVKKYFGDCDAAVIAAEKAPFTAQGLTAVVQAYNGQCSAARQLGTDLLAPANPGASFRLNAGAVAGGHFTVADNGLHPVGGLYADVLHAGRVLALHGQVTLTTLGGKATGSPALGQYDWRGTQAQFRLGVRLFTALRPRQQLFGGFGISMDFISNFRSSLSGAVSKDFFGSTAGWTLPYVEAGVRRQRFTLSLDSRFPVEVADTHYAGRLWNLSAMLAFRLTGNADTARKPD